MSHHTLKDFYDGLYGENPNIFGDSSLNFLKEIEDTYISVGRHALDIGSGEGLTAQYLAELGFVVDAVDLSNNAFSGIRDHGRVSTHVMPIESFKPSHNYDLVLFALTAHHIAPEIFKNLVYMLQSYTSKNGVHCFRIFTTNGEFYKQSGNSRFFDDNHNLNECYRSWMIIHDKIVLLPAATSHNLNEVREVVFQKI